VKCATSKPYLHIDKTCYAKCPVGYFEDIFTLTCKPCNSSCFACNGQTATTCTSCTGSLYYIPDKKICDSNCEKYGLTKSNTIDNYCTLCIINYYNFLINLVDGHARITNYDITKPIDPNKLSILIAEIYNFTSPNYKINWRFSANDTIALNSNFQTPEKSPFDPNYNLNETTVRFISNWFETERNYVFFLDLQSFNNIYNVTIPNKFVLNMNKKPTGGSISVYPQKGYQNSTLIAFSCKNFTDDTTTSFLYKFSYNYYNTITRDFTGNILLSTNKY